MKQMAQRAKAAQVTQLTTQLILVPSRPYRMYVANSMKRDCGEKGLVPSTNAVPLLKGGIMSPVKLSVHYHLFPCQESGG